MFIAAPESSCRDRETAIAGRSSPRGHQGAGRNFSSPHSAQEHFERPAGRKASRQAGRPASQQAKLKFCLTHSCLKNKSFWKIQTFQKIEALKQLDFEFKKSLSFQKLICLKRVPGLTQVWTSVNGSVAMAVPHICRQCGVSNNDRCEQLLKGAVLFASVIVGWMMNFCDDHILCVSCPLIFFFCSSFSFFGEVQGWKRNQQLWMVGFLKKLECPMMRLSLEPLESKQHCLLHRKPETC